jgi:hypothetical protein
MDPSGKDKILLNIMDAIERQIFPLQNEKRTGKLRVMVELNFTQGVVATACLSRISTGEFIMKR